MIRSVIKSRIKSARPKIASASSTALNLTGPPKTQPWYVLPSVAPCPAGKTLHPLATGQAALPLALNLTVLCPCQTTELFKQAKHIHPASGHHEACLHSLCRSTLFPSATPLWPCMVCLVLPPGDCGYMPLINCCQPHLTRVRYPVPSKSLEPSGRNFSFTYEMKRRWIKQGRAFIKGNKKSPRWGTFELDFEKKTTVNTN